MRINKAHAGLLMSWNANGTLFSLGNVFINVPNVAASTYIPTRLRRAIYTTNSSTFTRTVPFKRILVLNTAPTEGNAFKAIQAVSLS